VEKVIFMFVIMMEMAIWIYSIIGSLIGQNMMQMKFPPAFYSFLMMVKDILLLWK